MISASIFFSKMFSGNIIKHAQFSLKPCLRISRKDREDMFGNMYFKLSRCYGSVSISL